MFQYKFLQSDLICGIWLPIDQVHHPQGWCCPVGFQWLVPCWRAATTYFCKFCVLNQRRYPLIGSVTRPSRADSSLIIPAPSTRSTKATIPDLSIRATFIDAPEGTQICSLAKLRLLFLWMVAVRDRVLVNIRSCKLVSVSILPSCKAIQKSVTSSGVASRPDCSDLRIEFDGLNGSAFNSTMHTSRSWTACSSFFHSSWLAFNVLPVEILIILIPLESSFHSCHVVCISCNRKQLLLSLQKLEPSLFWGS